LPRHLQISGIGWLAGAVVLIGLVIVVFAGGLHGVAVDVTVADDAVVGWLGGLNLPGLVAVMQVLAMLSSWWVLKAVSVALLLALLALRRFRHLIVYAIFSGLLSLLTTDVLGAIAQRPRPFGVPIRTSWGGWALPPLELTTLAFLMVVVLYTLVPEGRWRNVGKFAATGLIALAALGRMALGADAPTDVLVGVAIGVTLPLLGSSVGSASSSERLAARPMSRVVAGDSWGTGSEVGVARSRVVVAAGYQPVVVARVAGSVVKRGTGGLVGDLGPPGQAPPAGTIRSSSRSPGPTATDGNRMVAALASRQLADRSTANGCSGSCGPSAAAADPRRGSPPAACGLSRHRPRWGVACRHDQGLDRPGWLGRPARHHRLLHPGDHQLVVGAGLS
jgi:membrane-associated phospholipid phosphatase